MEVINALIRADMLNTAQSFIVLVSGLSRRDMEDVGSRLPSIYDTVTSKVVTLAMPLLENGKDTNDDMETVSMLKLFYIFCFTVTYFGTKCLQGRSLIVRLPRLCLVATYKHTITLRCV